MSHKAAMSERYYAGVRGNFDAARAYHTMETLRLSSVGESSIVQPPTQEKVAIGLLTTQKKLLNVFEDYIKNKKTPPLPVCLKYETVFKRSKKKIQGQLW